MSKSRGRYDPRQANGAARRKLRQWVRRQVAAYDLPCHICGQPIDLDLPSSDPMGLTLDEIIPVSRWKEGGYPSPQACALDRGNVAPAHRICNVKRQNKPLEALRNNGEAAKIANDATLPTSRQW